LPDPPSRGPTGRAPPPPAWLHSVDLPIDIIPAGGSLIRIHRLAHHPIFFGPGSGVPPTFRFDSPSGAFGVLYVALSLAGALAETLLRNPARRMVAHGQIASRASTEIRSGRDLKLVQLHGAGLQRIGCDNAISTGPYDPCGPRADALWSHPAAPDGLAFRSRHDPGEICIALFERSDLNLAATATTPLTDQLPEVSMLLNRYGKSVSMA
jgi:hypothetical protein